MTQIHKKIAFYSCFVHVLFSFILCLSGIIEARFYETLFQIPQSPYVLLISLLLAAMWLRSHSFSFGYCMKKSTGRYTAGLCFCCIDYIVLIFYSLSLSLVRRFILIGRGAQMRGDNPKRTGGNSLALAFPLSPLGFPLALPLSLPTPLCMRSTYFYFAFSVNSAEQGG